MYCRPTRYVDMPQYGVFYLTRLWLDVEAKPIEEQKMTEEELEKMQSSLPKAREKFIHWIEDSAADAVSVKDVLEKEMPLAACWAGFLEGWKACWQAEINDLIHDNASLYKNLNSETNERCRLEEENATLKAEVERLRSLLGSLLGQGEKQ